MNHSAFAHPVTLTGKRFIDLLIALIGIILTLPLYPLIALAIRLDSSGPIIYQQMRIGFQKDNYIRLFMMKKFRTMRADAEAQTGPVWAQVNDPRITRVGNFLRKTRLDELPQLWNVLAGDMSIVGPRPERPGMYKKLEEHIPFYSERTFDVTPGITGLAQVSMGYDQTVDDVKNKVAYDHAYALALANPWQWIKTDTYIMIKTVFSMATGKGH